jgi:hypothetical protein
MKCFAVSKSRSAAAWLAIALTFSGCGDAAGPRTPRVRAVRIEPTNYALSAGATLQLHAVVDADAGADTTVRWTSEPSQSGAVSPAGLVTTCYPPGTIVVRATSVADSTQSATLPCTRARWRPARTS